MLPKNRRISRKDFPYILKNKKTYHTPGLFLYLAPIDLKNKPESKVSFSISKKVCPKATDRNRYRRWGYFTVSKRLKKIKPGFYCFFSFKKTGKVETYNNVEKNVLELLSSSGVLI
jgi:ribonuclease P protein component